MDQEQKSSLEFCSRLVIRPACLISWIEEEEMKTSLRFAFSSSIAAFSEEKRHYLMSYEWRKT